MVKCHVCTRTLSKYDREFYYDLIKNKPICRVCAGIEIRKRDAFVIIKGKMKYF